MRILIAPDKFKGSLTAVEAAGAIAEGALRVYPDAVTTQFPVADGGEGTLEAAVAAGYEERINAVVGPILAPIGAAWALRKDGSGATTAVIETAQASGLAHMEPTPENSLRAHSYGCGQLIAAALDAGATEIVLGVGGSAMTDGGSGALRALGLKPLDAAGNVVPLGGGSLADAVALDLTGLDPRLSAVTFRIAVDVQSPLYGTTGAAHVFGRQKGADDDAIEKLDAGLRNWASLLREATGRDVNVPGAGAAGGFPASFLAFTQATLEGGFALVAALTGLAEKLADADLVITGEGSMDSQSLTGKAPIALAEAARDRGIPVVAVAGRITVTPEELAEHGVVAAAQLLDVAPSPQDAMSDAGKYLAWATRQVLEGA
ncbi:glycerate kinase [Arthrobacter globiformis]|jgi:glycerate kinase|uniref:Glycerate kinase n=1 Tax=Arthrobacter globiformis TaxID=1665 RepID=A0A328HKE9_ARTGO|nr:glycerate kinase [Arthrobacter globiformis]RAM39039.1 glycerate kinase [Arthrobacter globiformis]